MLFAWAGGFVDDGAGDSSTCVLRYVPMLDSHGGTGLWRGAGSVVGVCRYVADGIYIAVQGGNGECLICAD